MVKAIKNYRLCCLNMDLSLSPWGGVNKHPLYIRRNSVEASGGWGMPPSGQHSGTGVGISLLWKYEAAEIDFWVRHMDRKRLAFPAYVFYSVKEYFLFVVKGWDINRCPSIPISIKSDSVKLKGLWILLALYYSKTRRSFWCAILLNLATRHPSRRAQTCANCNGKC